MPLKPINRIPMPDDETFFREYVYKRKPVILTNLFEGEGIRQIKSLKDAQHAFGHVKLKIQSEYSRANSPENRIMTFNEYWNFVQEHESTDLLCTENEIPARIMSLFKLPSVCMAGDVEEDEVFGLPRKYGHYDLLSYLFVANKGNVAHMHWDGDQRQVLLYQVFGRKQVILFQPESGIYLRPLDHKIPFSGLSLEQMTEKQKCELIEMAEGYYATIYPGEAIYMPMLIWHHLEYTDNAMSFNIRFGRNKYGRFLCVDNFHRDCYIQNFAANLADKMSCESVYKEAISSIIEEFKRPAANLEYKVRNMRKLFRDLCAQHSPHAQLERYCPSEREQEDIDRIMKDIKQTMSICYSDPKVVKQTRPAGPISPTQKRHIEKLLRKYGYPFHTQQRLLLNRIGKSHLDQLTKAEAAQFMLYLVSPGASW